MCEGKPQAPIGTVGGDGFDHRVGHLPALRPVSALGESTIHASREGGYEGTCHQEVAAPTRQGQGLRPLRRKVSGDPPRWWPGPGVPGAPAAATVVAGATNVAPPARGGCEVPVVCVQATTIRGATVGGGAGANMMQNQNGVVINLVGTSQGLKFKLSMDGVKMTLKAS